MTTRPFARHRDLKCHECGMPLEYVGQFHPWEACRIFERTHDSSVVAVEMSRLQREAQSQDSVPKEVDRG